MPCLLSPQPPRTQTPPCRRTQQNHQVTRKYSQLKKPVYGKRQDAISGVPEFWFRVVCSMCTYLCVCFGRSGSSEGGPIG